MIAWMLRLVAALLLVVSTQPYAAEAGTITLVEGSVRLLRGAVVLQATEGVRVQPGDMLETDGICVVEFGDGLLLGLGPASRIHLPETGNRARNTEPGQAIFVLSGWLKLQSGKQASSNGYLVLTTLMGIATREAKLLVHAAEQRASVFMESGSARLFEPDEGGRMSKGPALDGGQFASRAAGQRLTVHSRPDGAFLAAMPRGFRDALPARPDRLKSSPKAPRADHDARYDEARDLLQLPQAWRGDMVRRFSGRLRDAEFRKAVATNLARHPEWRPILYPPRAADLGRVSLRDRDSRPKEHVQ